ncbi:MAG TPA: zinc-binding dehydrogenase [Amycolatopsis sp.]|jgi:zinc-binding alcohol dehydrogenase family protein
MKALGYEKAHPLDAFALELIDVPEPRPRETDLLVEIRAVGINPGETAIRRTRSAEPGGRLILGWEFSGVVLEVGPAVTGFAAGDRVMGSGEMARDGAWAERLAVDHRVVAKIPDQLSFVDAASLPIGGLTAWEALFRDQDGLPPGVDRVLVLGSAGGVGSMATQLLKAKTPAFVIGTASRPESREWSTTMGADLVVDHSGDVVAQLNDAGVGPVDLVLSTAGTIGSLGWIAEALRPFGHVSAIDLDGPVDTAPLMRKSLSLHAEVVFSRMDGQATVLAELARDAAEGRLRPITMTVLKGLTVDSMRQAHELLETGRTIGKVVLSFQID